MAIIEVGIGGEYDATNVIEHPVVCGVVSLGFDHQPILGETLPEIAWHKGGIAKVSWRLALLLQGMRALTGLGSTPNRKVPRFSPFRRKARP